jgi:signal transduction histidine kinase
MDAQVARLALLIDDLLDIGRLREGRLALRCEAVDLVALARQVVDRLQAELRLDDTDSREIRVEAGADTLPGTWDPRRLDQVLTNLLSNALKYSPAGSPVTVRLDRADGWARLSIRDHGIGIPTDEHEHLFRPFQRGRNAPAMYAGGLGLGLSISKGIVDRHGGRIRAESCEGEGSTFTVELPTDAD